MKLNIWQWIGLVLLVIGGTMYIIRTSGEPKAPDNKSAPTAAPQPAPAPAPAPAAPTTAPAQ